MASVVPTSGGTPGQAALLRRRILLQGALLGPALAALSGCGEDSSPRGGGRRTDYSATIRDGRAAIAQAMADTDTSSVSVALADGEHVVWQEAFGVIDDTARQPAGLNTLYNIGSVSKVFVAMAIMILRDRGLVELDAPVVRYLKDFRMESPAFDAITVRMLISHTSGLPGANYNNIFCFEPILGYARRTQEVVAGQRLKHAPGEFAVYCNDGFTLAERVVEAVTGQNYARFVAQEVLAPLDMALSRYPLAHYPAGSVALPRWQGAQQPQEFVNAYGTGGLSSTPSEMMNLARMFLGQGEFKGRRILSKEAVAAMATNQAGGVALNPAPSWQWGLGWDSTDHPALRAVGFRCWEKNGGTAFFGSDFFVMPETQLAVMITGTSTSYGASALAERILLHALVDKHLLPRLPPKLPAAPSPQGDADPAAVNAIKGYYASFEGVSKVVDEGNGSVTLMLHENGAWKTTAAGLRLRSDGWFAAEGEARSWRLATEGPYRYLLMRVAAGYGHYRVTMPSAQKIDAAPVIPAAWQARLGSSWVLANEHESSTMLALDSPRVTLSEIPELSGYVQIDGRQPLLPETDSRTQQFLKIPVNHGRDLYELIAEIRNGEEWLRFGGYRYRPVSAAPIGPGTHQADFDSEGHSECFRIAGAGSAVVSGARACRLYDQHWRVLRFIAGRAQIDLPAGQDSFLVVYGEASTRATLTLA